MAQQNDEAAVEAVRELLTQEQSAEAARLFVDGQQRGVLPKGEGLLPWVMTTFGPELTRTLIHAFAHQACVFCTKGFVSCERCGGKGHTDYTFVCDDCFGLGVKPCEFCNGTGWVSWDFVPEGLRLLTLAERTKIAVDSLRARPEEAEAGTGTERFLKAVQTLLSINKDMGVLENTVLFAGKEQFLSAQDRKVLGAMVHDAFQETALARHQCVTMVEHMIAALEILSQDASIDEDKRLFEKDRIEFYRSAIKIAPPFEGTFLRHAFLEPKASDGRSPDNSGSQDADSRPDEVAEEPPKEA